MAKNNTYYINERALTFTPNYQGLRDVVHVSIASGAAISVMVPGVPELGFDINADYQRWSLTAATTKLGTTGAYFIYARLQRSEKKAMIIFSVNDYNVDGSVGQGESATEESADYWYIKIGSITASKTSGGSDVDRVLDYDSGMLGTPQGNTENNAALDEMFEFNSSDKTIKVKHPLVNLIANGLAKFNGIVEFAKGIKIFGKTIESFIGTPEDKTEADALAESEDTLVTPKFVKVYGDLSYVSKVNDDSVEGNIAFKKDISVDGKVEAGTLDVKEDATIGGNQTIQGTQEVGGLQTLKGGMQTEQFSNVAGTVNGAQLTADGLFSAAGIIANSFKIHELIYNIVRAQGGKMVLSNAATVENCRYKLIGQAGLVDEYSGDTANIEYVLLTIKADEHNKGKNPFTEGDILYGYVNNIGASGEIAKGGECTMRVTDEPTSDAPMVVKAVMYEVRNDIDVNNTAFYEYVGSNIPPTPSMALAQRGSTTDASRRTSIFLDAENGNIVMLQNVSTPRIKKEYYGTLNGILPTDLYNDIKTIFASISPTSPVMFAEYGIFRNLIEYDHQGRFIQKENNRGEWSASETYEYNASYYDVVTYDGQLWKCIAASGSTSVNPPSLDNDDWLLLVSKGDSVMYELIPSTNVVHLRADGTLSDESIFVTVGETSTLGGYKVLSTQEQLDERNLSIEYSINGGQRYALYISTGGFLALEDGSGILVTEENIPLALEGDGLSVQKDYDKITLYLTHKGVEKYSYTIPILKDGSGIKVDEKATYTEYALSTSSTVKPTSWSKTRPAAEDGKYLWERTTLVFTDGSSTELFTVSRMGVDGKGIISSETTYYISEDRLNPEDIAESLWGGFPSASEQKIDWFLYSRTIVTYNADTDGDGKNDTATTYSVVQIGTGAYYAGQTQYFALGESYSEVPDGYPSNIGENGAAGTGNLNIGGDWSTVRPSKMDTVKRYLWTFTVSYDSKGNQFVSPAVCAGDFVKGISSIVETYAISAYDEYNENQTDIDWSKADDESHKAKPTTEKPYQWRRVVTTYNDGSEPLVTYSISAVLGKYVRIDSDNDNITMLYDGNGNKLSSDEVCKLSVYVNQTERTGVSFFKTDSNVTSSLSGNILTIKGVTATSGYVDVKANIDGIEYKTRIIVLRLVGQDKYDITLSKSAISYNTTTNQFANAAMTVSVARTKADGTREKPTSLSSFGSDYKLMLYPNGNSTGAVDLTSRYNWSVVELTEADINEAWHDFAIVLIKGTTELDRETVMITKVENGGDGVNYMIQFDADSQIISRSIDPETLETLDILDKKVITYKLLINGVDAGKGTSADGSFIYQNYHISREFDSADGWAINSYSAKDDSVTITLHAKKGVNNRPTRFTLTLTPKDSKSGLTTVTASIPIIYVQRGYVGNTGPMPVKYGKLILGEAYKLIRNNDGDVIGKPVCYYEPTKQHYILEQDVTAAQNSTEAPDPKYWRASDKKAFLEAAVLLADFAYFGSEDGAVFYDNYLFSNKGLNKLNESVPYDPSMFDNDGTLNGEIIPHLFLDFKNGASKFSKLSESFIKLKHQGGASNNAHLPSEHVVDVDKYHNVSCQPVLNTADGTCVIVMPKAVEKEQRFMIDGTHSTIIHEYYAPYSFNPTDGGYINSIIAVCADEKLLTTEFSADDFLGDTNAEYGETYTNGWFIWRNYRTKIILMTPGTMLKLRSCMNEDGGLVWFVENSSEFEILNANVEFYDDYNSVNKKNLYTLNSNAKTDVQASYRSPIVIGTPTINLFDVKAGYYEGITTTWVWDVAGGLLGNDLDNYNGCHIAEKSTLNVTYNNE